ncbi:protein BEARSKIN1-like [Tripterygium wilfordii]|uniref:Protein BEARSKIN1-like n=1 Tax=Tripterygium wilfordii TaxID=458696 RepID=A0A7J7C311_TRIWF|nr:NAC domain-containing protein 45-like [Tripterygium wilfordii]KAF5728146.1 protein BEARSKIN1-like [Tripterygium wilfordii]
MAPMSLPPGFRFHPTDEELVAYYLDRKISGHSIELEIIPEVDLYKCEPWDLPEKSFLPSKDMEWYFYSPRDRKYPNGSRTNRATRAGYWKATGKDRAVQSRKRAVGMKKTLVYYSGRAPHGCRTNWIMHEYRLIHSLCPPDPFASNNASTLKDSYALCRIFKKSIEIPKRKEDKVEDDHSSGIIINRSREVEDDENMNNNDNSLKFIPNSDTSSSDLTQGTPADDLQAPFAGSDEANSSAKYIYSFNNHVEAHLISSSSTLFQDMDMPSSWSMHCQQPYYPPLEVEDFPQINIITETIPSKTTNDDHQRIYDEYKDCMNGTLEEILSLCSSQPTSLLPMQRY